MKTKAFLIIALLCAVVQGAWAQTNVSTESELTSAISSGTTVSVKLTADIALSNYVDIPSSKTVTIDLNDHSLNRGLSELTSYGIVIRVETGGTLTVKDSAGGGTITGGYDATGGGICVLGTLNFESGTISGCNGTKGGAIYITSDGTVNMTGGTISGCSASDCGGIYNNGTLTISGGTIQNCTSGQGGGGVVNYGAAYITGGTITGNTAKTRGGGVWNDEDASLTVTGGTITGNTAGTNGGGLFSKSHIIMRDNPVITGNTVGGSANNLYLVGDKQIICDGGAFTSGASIGVTLENYGRKFTNLYSFNNDDTAPATYFTMDNSSYAVALVDGEAYPGILYVERSWEGSNTGGHVKSETKTCTSYSTISTTELTDDGWYVLSGENVFNDRIIISADVKLILADGSNAEFTKGIRSGNGSKLTIYAQSGGTGTLRATGSGDAANAAIGATENTMGGSLIIHGGTIDASASEDYGAGIGGGDGESSGMTSITIYGGSIGATGKKSAAGIGGGQHNNTNPTVTIYGGTVIANGGKYAAGIGGGEDRCNGTITIYGGSVIATGGENGAGIGGGEEGDLTTVTIYGGEVKAYGGKYGAGIGGGENGDNGTVTIYGGTVKAIGGGYAAGIGGGYCAKGGTVTIYDGTVDASSGDGSIGIGGDDAATVNIHGGTVTAYGNYGTENTGGLGIGVDGGTLTFHMTGGNVTAEAATSGNCRNGAGLGGYYDSNVELHITIDGGTLIANGGNGGAGIGSGSSSTGVGWVNGGDIKSGSEITINGGTVTATAGHQGAGIGSGFGGNNKGTITINGGTVTATGKDGGAGIGGGNEGTFNDMGGNDGTIIINGGKVTAYTDSEADTDDFDQDDPQAIGHGEDDENSGSLTIADNMCVKNDDGTTTYSSGERVERCRDLGKRIIEECEHTDHCTPNGADGHTVSCTYCATSGNEKHTYGSGLSARTCSRCNYVMSDPKTVTIYMTNSSGTGYGDATTESVQYGTAYTLPDCTSVPSTMVFVGWDNTTTAPSLEAEDSELSSLKAAGDEVTVTDDVTYYARYQSTIWPGGGNGTVSDPYIISETSHWNTLASSIENKKVDFSGKYIRLDADIEVTTMVGTSSIRFRGNFDGNGHTLTVDYTSTEDVCAPFRFTYGATIQNLKTAGTINTSKSNAGGVVGKNFTASLTLKNVISSVTINSSKSGAAYHGGLVGYAINASIEGCAFIGKLLGGSSNTCGGLLGQKSNTSGSSVTIKNCLFLPTEVSVGTSGSYTFAAGTTGLVTVTNSFYSQALGTAQGTQSYTVQSGDGLTLDYGGGTSYGNITAYTFDQGGNTTLGGLLYDGKLYTGSSTKVSFTPETSNGKKPTLSTTSGTLAEGNDGTWTLTMASANANATITATGYSNYTVTFYDGGFTDEANTSHKSNDEIISDNRNHIANVTISGRTLYKDNSWNTICLPFDMTAAQVTALLAPSELKELDVDGKYDSSGKLDNEDGTFQTGFDGGTLYLYFKDATAIEAGKPYIIKWTNGGNITPTFTGVTIDSHNPEAIESTDGKVSFLGNYDPVTIGSSGDNTKLYLGADNNLYWPSAARTIKSFRAYFQLHGIEAGEVAHARMFFGEDDETTEIKEIENVQCSMFNDQSNNAWYDLSGRKLGSRPTQKGIYIYNGKKRVIK